MLNNSNSSSSDIYNQKETWQQEVNPETGNQLLNRIVGKLQNNSIQSYSTSNSNYGTSSNDSNCVDKLASYWKLSTTRELFVKNVAQWIVLENKISYLNEFDQIFSEIEIENELNDVFENKLNYTPLLMDTVINNKNTINSNNNINSNSNTNNNLNRTQNNITININVNNVNNTTIINNINVNNSELKSVYIFDYNLLKLHNFNINCKEVDSRSFWVGKTATKFGRFGELIPCKDETNIGSCEKISLSNYSQLENLQALFYESNVDYNPCLNFYQNIVKILYKTVPIHANNGNYQIVQFSQKELEIITVNELFELILSYLDVYTLRNMSLMNREYYNMLTLSQNGNLPLFKCPDLAIVYVKYRHGDEEINLINMGVGEREEKFEPRKKKRKL